MGIVYSSNSFLHRAIKSRFRFFTLNRIIKNCIDTILSELRDSSLTFVDALAPTEMYKDRIADNTLHRQPEKQGKLYHLNNNSRDPWVINKAKNKASLS